MVGVGVGVGVVMLCLVWFGLGKTNGRHEPACTGRVERSGGLALRKGRGCTEVQFSRASVLDSAKN